MKIRPGDGPGEWQPVAVYPWRYILGIVVFGALAIAFARKHMWIFMVLGLLCRNLQHRDNAAGLQLHVVQPKAHIVHCHPSLEKCATHVPRRT
jgi:hypothetical protein